MRGREEKEREREREREREGSAIANIITDKTMNLQKTGGVGK